MLGGVSHVPVGHKPLQPADGHGLALDAPHALGLALALLGADAAGDGGQAVGIGDDLVGALEVSLGHLGDEFRNAHIDRAALHAHGVGTVQAAGGLLLGLLFGKAQRDLVEIVDALLRGLFGHGGAGRVVHSHY